MRDEEDGAVAGCVEHVVDEALRALRVEMRRRLVEHEHRSVGEERAREHQALALAAGEAASRLADDGVEPLRKRG